MALNKSIDFFQRNFVHNFISIWFKGHELDIFKLTTDMFFMRFKSTEKFIKSIVFNKYSLCYEHTRFAFGRPAVKLNPIFVECMTHSIR